MVAKHGRVDGSTAGSTSIQVVAARPSASYLVAPASSGTRRAGNITTLIIVQSSFSIHLIDFTDSLRSGSKYAELLLLSFSGNFLQTLIICLNLELPAIPTWQSSGILWLPPPPLPPPPGAQPPPPRLRGAPSGQNCATEKRTTSSQISQEDFAASKDSGTLEEGKLQGEIWYSVTLLIGMDIQVQMYVWQIQVWYNFYFSARWVHTYYGGCVNVCGLQTPFYQYPWYTQLLEKG